MTPVPFDDLKAALRGEVIDATSTYRLLTKLVFPMYEQQKLHDHYPFILSSLYASLSRNVVMTVCRLFDPANDQRHASLSTLLRRVSAHHASDDPAPHLVERRKAYVEAIPAGLKAIEDRWPPLAQHRSAYLAHRDLTKTKLPEVLFTDIWAAIEQAQEILSRYFSAYEDAGQMFEYTNVEHEPKDFLEWCRLDDYATHFARHLEERRHERERRFRAE
jgi:hypothetical protein